MTSVSEVKPGQWEVVEDHEKTEVTLVTCLSVKDNSKRVVVTGEFLKEKEIRRV